MSVLEGLPLFAATPAARSKLEKAFWKFHDSHPGVYTKLVELARLWKSKRGVERLGIATLYEACRWTIAISGLDLCGIKLNNNHRAYYARLIMEREPDLVDFFQLRQQRRQASIGPKGSTLEPSIHRS
jgi:hypothetical protein